MPGMSSRFVLHGNREITEARNPRGVRLRRIRLRFNSIEKDEKSPSAVTNTEVKPDHSDRKRSQKRKGSKNKRQT